MLPLKIDSSMPGCEKPKELCLYERKVEVVVGVSVK